MLSRLSFRAIRGINNPVCPALTSAVRSSATSSSGEEYSWYAKSGTRFPWEGPERDVVNFPRPVQQVEPGKTRFLFVPEEWFSFFYKKTGVTGPYALGLGLYNYLLSKELWIIEHEYYYVYATIIIFGVGSAKYGNQIANWVDKLLEKQEQDLKALTSDQILEVDEAIKEEKTHQWQIEGQKLMVDAKRENVALQQEAAYRERAMLVYNSVKSRLEFHTQKNLMERRVSQKHMCNWIVKQVLNSIKSQSDKDILQKCLVDLKGLSARA